VSQGLLKQSWVDRYAKALRKNLKPHAQDLSVCDLAALVFKELHVASCIFNCACAVRHAVHGLAVYYGLHQSNLGSLPLRTARVGA
jgi:hypothetical protein